MKTTCPKCRSERAINRIRIAQTVGGTGFIAELPGVTCPDCQLGHHPTPDEMRSFCGSAWAYLMERPTFTGKQHEEWRVCFHLSLKDAAEIYGISPSTLQDLEAAQPLPTQYRTKLQALHRYLTQDQKRLQFSGVPW